MAKAKKALPAKLKEALLDAMSVAETTVDGADYLVTQFRQLLTEANALDDYKDIMQKVEDFAKYTKFKLQSSSQPWLGQMAEDSAFKNMQANMAVDAAKDLERLGIGTQEEVSFDFAINEKTSEFRRRTSTQDHAAVAAFDTTFNAWLAENNVRSSKGILYETTPTGKIKEDAQGKQIKVNPEEMKNLITDPEKGFAKYMEEKRIKVVCLEEEFPTPEKGIEAQRAIKEAIKVAPEVSAPEAKTEEVVEPQTTMSSGV
jgi:hypothetical protein